MGGKFGGFFGGNLRNQYIKPHLWKFPIVSYKPILSVLIPSKCCKSYYCKTSPHAKRAIGNSTYSTISALEITGFLFMKLIKSSPGRFVHLESSVAV